MLVRQTAQGIIEIGQRLIEVKERLGHGNFIPWLKSEFNWSLQSAKRFMNVAETFGQNQQIVDFYPSALYALAAPSIPDEAREEALTLAESGLMLGRDRGGLRELVEREIVAVSLVENFPQVILIFQEQS